MAFSVKKRITIGISISIVLGGIVMFVGHDWAPPASASNSLAAVDISNRAPMTGDQARESALKLALDEHGAIVTGDALQSVPVSERLMDVAEAKALVNDPNWFNELPVTGSKVWIVSVSAYGSYDSVPKGYNALANGYTVLYDESTGAYLGTILGVKLI